MDSFTLNEWGNTAVEVFDLREQVQEEFQELRDKFDAFCQKHDLPGMIVVCASQSEGNHSLIGSTQLSRHLGRNIPEFLACDHILKNSIAESYGYVAAVVDVDVERNIREAKKRHH